MENTFVWYLKLTKRFFLKTPFHASVSVVFTNLSQLFILISFFLPLKIVILIGSERMPRYFPIFFESFDRDALIVGLSVIAVASYALHLLTERMLKKNNKSGAELLLKKSNKIVVFENQTQFAKRSYYRYIRSFSQIVFVHLVFCVLLLLYPFVFLVVSLYFALIVVFFLFIHKAYGRNLNVVILVDKYAKPLAGAGFLIVFGSIIVDYIYFGPPSILFVMVCMILSRQAFNKISGIVTDIISLHNQRNKIDVLFFPKRHYRAVFGKKELSVWRAIQKKTWYDDLIAVLCEQGVSAKAKDCKVTWLQNTTPGVVGFIVDVLSEVGNIKSYYLKIYDEKKSSWALHEASLLIQKNASVLSSPKLIGCSLYNGLHCHVFDVNGLRPLRAQPDPKKINMLLARIAQFSPDNAIVDSYRRSRPFTWSRLSEEVFERIKLVASIDNSSVDAISVCDFVSNINGVSNKLKKMPLAVVNPDVSIGHLWCKENDSDELFVSHWGRWSLEPVGSALPISLASDRQCLDEFYDEFIKKRSAAKKFTVESMRMAIFFYEFEKRCRRQNYQGALKLIPSIMSAFKKI